CLFFVEMARAGTMNTPGPFNFRGCGLTAECLLAREMVRVRFPAAAPFSNKSRTSLCGRVSKTQPAWGGTRATCQWGRGRQVMHLPCKQVDLGGLPSDSANFKRGKVYESTGRKLSNILRWTGLQLSVQF